MKLETLIITENMIRGIARLSETVIFIMLGFELIQRFEYIFIYSKFCLLTLLACLVARAIVTTSMVTIINCFRSQPINFKMQIIIFVGGLRGALAYAMAFTIKGQVERIFMTSTVFIIIVTNLINGILTKPMVQCLGLMENSRENHQLEYYKDKNKNWILRAFCWLEDVLIWPLVSERGRRDNASV